MNALTENDQIQLVADEIRNEAKELKTEARSMRWKHQFFTVMTILFGVAAPAVVTYSPPSGIEVWWKLAAIMITAFASASATIRTVLRYGDRYANSSLTGMALDKLFADLNAKRDEVLGQVKKQFVSQKLSEYSSWTRNEMYTIKKAYVEKEVAATTKEKIEFVQAPAIRPDEKLDPTKKEEQA